MCVYQCIAKGINFLKGGITAKAYAYCSIHNLGGELHCFKNLAATAFLTGRTFGNIDFTGFEEIHDNLAAITGKSNGKKLGSATAYDDNAFNLIFKPFNSVGPKRFEVSVIFGKCKAGAFAGFSKCENLGHCLCAGTFAAFLTRTGDVWGQIETLLYVERTYTLGGVNLVTAYGKKINSKF